MALLDEQQCAHDEAVRRGQDRYSDPASGARVFTELFHRRRGFCCGFRCLHCPYDHANVDVLPDTPRPGRQGTVRGPASEDPR